MSESPQRSLDDALADLPRDVPPPPNLWPGIVHRLPRRSRRPGTLAFAAAAGLAGACLAGALTWAVLHGRASPPEPVLPLAAQIPALDEARNAGYVAARDTLEASFRERLALLDPATRAKIEANLAIIRRAHEEIRKALASDPASPVLEQLWQSTWHDEIDLYDQVVQATQPTMTRT